MDQVGRKLAGRASAVSALAGAGFDRGSSGSDDRLVISLPG
jgi:hypothetical protein